MSALWLLIPIIGIPLLAGPRLVEILRHRREREADPHDQPWGM